jgi:RHS repeat-associated protein
MARREWQPAGPDGLLALRPVGRSIQVHGDRRHLDYGLRIYNPVTGGWQSKDPIGEAGGLNLFGFVGNDGVNQFDVLGLDAKDNSEKIDKVVQYWRGVARSELGIKGVKRPGDISLRLEIIEAALRSSVQCGDYRSKEDWEEVDGYYQIRADKKASDVIPRLLNNPGSRVCCKKHLELVMASAYYNHLRKNEAGLIDKLDKVLSGPGTPNLSKIGNGLIFDEIKGRGWENELYPGMRVDRVLLPGDQTHFANPHYHEMTSGDWSVQEGSNTVYLGTDGKGATFALMGEHEAITLWEHICGRAERSIRQEGTVPRLLYGPCQTPGLIR